jgi:hypothetical protein
VLCIFAQHKCTPAHRRRNGPAINFIPLHVQSTFKEIIMTSSQTTSRRQSLQTLTALAAATALPFAATPAHAQSSGAWLIVTHKVEDFARWKVVFDSTNAMKKPHGWKRSNIYTLDGDRNNVMVVEEFATMEGAKAFASSAELRAAMGKAGVVGAPDIRFVNQAFQVNV